MILLGSFFLQKNQTPELKGFHGILEYAWRIGWGCYRPVKDGDTYLLPGATEWQDLLLARGKDASGPCKGTE